MAERMTYREFQIVELLLPELAVKFASAEENGDEDGANFILEVLSEYHRERIRREGPSSGLPDASGSGKERSERVARGQ